METIYYGTKYAVTQGLCRTEIAKLVRADIKAAVASGEIPRGKYSVRTSNYSGGGSIDVRISHLEGVTVTNKYRVVWDLENPHAGHFNCPEESRWLYSEEAREVLEKVDAILQAYNFDGSDLMTDYFNVRYYGHAEFDSSGFRAERDAMVAEYEAAKAAPKMSAQEDWLAWAC